MSSGGATRTDVVPVWPSRLELPRERLVYLDLNHWIMLAKADRGHPDGRRWRSALETIRVHRSDWTFVMSMPLIMELSGNRRRAQRADLGTIIEELTAFACILPLSTIAALEFESSLAALTPIRERFEPVELVGHGVLRACGLQGGVRVRDRAGHDVTARVRLQARAGPMQFDRRRAEAERQLDRSVIRGPADDDEERALRALGWDPSVAHSGAGLRAQQERDFAASLDAESRWRRGRLRDVIAARYIALEIESIREEALAAHELRLKDVLDIDRARALTDSMPAGDGWITLRTAKHRSASSRWQPNDIFDVDALSVAVAYCDVVVTERHSVHVLKHARSHERYGTELLTDLDQLAELLAST